MVFLLFFLVQPGEAAESHRKYICVQGQEKQQPQQQQQQQQQQTTEQKQQKQQTSAAFRRRPRRHRGAGGGGCGQSMGGRVTVRQKLFEKTRRGC